MLNHFTFRYWIDDGWYVGRLKEIPSVFTLEALKKNVHDAYKLMMDKWEMIDKVKLADIHINYSMEELAEDLR